MKDSNIPEVIVKAKDPLPEENGLCDSVWACLLNDYIDEEIVNYDAATKITSGQKEKPRRKSRSRSLTRKEKLKKRLGKNTLEEDRDAEKTDAVTYSDEASKVRTNQTSREEPPEELQKEVRTTEGPEAGAHETTSTVEDKEVSKGSSADVKETTNHKEQSPPTAPAKKDKVRSVLPRPPSALGKSSTNPFDDAGALPRSAPDAPGSSKGNLDAKREAPQERRQRKNKPKSAKIKPPTTPAKKAASEPDGEAGSSHVRSIEDYQKNVLESRRRAERKLALKRIREIKSKLAAKADP